MDLLSIKPDAYRVDGMHLIYRDREDIVFQRRGVEKDATSPRNAILSRLLHLLYEKDTQMATVFSKILCRLSPTPKKKKAGAASTTAPVLSLSSRTSDSYFPISAHNRTRYTSDTLPVSETFPCRTADRGAYSPPVRRPKPAPIPLRSAHGTSCSRFPLPLSRCSILSSFSWKFTSSIIRSFHLP